MSEYHKIETLFERDASTFVVDPTALKASVYGTIREWDVTEKIDGTNIRVMLGEDGAVSFGGRTDAAQIPADLVQYLIRTFQQERLKEVLWRDSEPDRRPRPRALPIETRHGDRRRHRRAANRDAVRQADEARHHQAEDQRLRGRQAMTRSFHVVTPADKPRDAVLDLLARLAALAAEAIEMATTRTDLAAYQRARLRHLGVAIGATVDDLQRGLTP